MSDLFHEDLANATVDLLHAIMAFSRWHCFLVLTKRAERMRAYYSDPETPRRVAEKVGSLLSVILPAAESQRLPARQADPAGRDTDAGSHWPLANLWLGVSVEDQDRMDRVRDLLQTPAAIRWVCFEPLLDRVSPDAVRVGDGYFDALGGSHYAVDGRGRAVPVEGAAWRPLDWVVGGGEIGAEARPMRPHWVRELRDKCVASGVPFFFKQWGEWAPASEDRVGQAMARVGKRAAGRLLDGRTWDEIPGAMRAG